MPEADKSRSRFCRDGKHPLKIAFVYNKGRLSRLVEARMGRAPKEFFLGALELETHGHEIGLFEINAEWPGGPFTGLLHSSLKKYLPEKTYGPLLRQTLNIIRSLRDYDCIVGTTSGIGFALGFWKKAGLLRPPLVAIHCGLVNNPYNLIRRKTTETLLRSMQTVLYGKGERDPLLDLFPGIRGKVTINQFGVDADFWSPGEKKRNYILSVGNDGRRDYNVLVEAARLIPLEFKIVTSLPLPDKKPGNIRPLRGDWHSETISDNDIRSLYRQALCVIIPLKESYQPSGQSVCLQAMACGSPVVLTKTKGLWSSSMMKDRQNVLLVRPGDCNDLINKIKLLRDDEGLRKRLAAEGRNTVCEQATSKIFAETMEACCLSLIHHTVM